MGSVSSGVVQPVRVLGTGARSATAAERRAYADALRSLTGESHGTDLAAWLRWWSER
jgi:hypothetical protein